MLLLFMLSMTTTVLAGMDLAGECEKHHTQAMYDDSDDPSAPGLDAKCCGSVLCSSCPSTFIPLDQKADLRLRPTTLLMDDVPASPKLQHFPPFRPPRA